MLLSASRDDATKLESWHDLQILLTARLSFRFLDFFFTTYIYKWMQKAALLELKIGRTEQQRMIQHSSESKFVRTLPHIPNSNGRLA